MSPRLWIDASVAHQPGVLRELTKLAKARGVDIVVHAHVHLEMCRHLRCEWGAEYNPATIKDYFQQQSVHVSDMHLDEATADRWAELLHRRFPSTEQWEAAKKSTLGGELSAAFVHERGHMPMTTDGWVALQVEDAPDDRVAVEDKGGEWQALRDSGRALTAASAKAWLESMPVP